MNKSKEVKKKRIALALDPDVIAAVDAYQQQLFLPSRSYTINIILRNHMVKVAKEMSTNAKS